MKFLKNKKAFEVNEQLVMMVFSIILIFVFLIFAIKSCSSLSEKQRSVILSDLEAEIQGVVELLSTKSGSVMHKIFEVPAGTDTVCFVDLNHSQQILQNTSLPSEYPMINQSLSVGDKKNVFLISNYMVTDALYGGKICFQNYPFYSCIATRGTILDVWFQGKAGCTTLYINWSMFPENFRNETLYDGSPLFLIKESRPAGTIDNWAGISAGVPLSLFMENKTTYLYNYSVFYKKQSVVSSDIEKLMDAYHTNKSYILDDSSGLTVSSPYSLQGVSTTNTDYLRFWKNYSSLILIDPGNVNAAVIGSLLAAYVNTPLIFINSSNKDGYADVMIGKQVFIMTHGPISLDNSTYDMVSAKASRIQPISDTSLQTEGSVPKFAMLKSTINFR